jgi:uncharacterized membrane protein SpoIIM required for sporulation
MQTILEIYKVYLRVEKLKKYFLLIIGFIFGFFDFSLFVGFCDDSWNENDLYDSENSWLTKREKEDARIAFEIFLNVIKIVVLIFSFFGFTLLVFCIILVFDIANAHNYQRPTD